MTVHFTLHISDPFPLVSYGLQKGKTAEHNIEQIQSGDAKTLTFKFDCEVKKGVDGEIICSGPFCQGPPRERFVYVTIGGHPGEGDTKYNGRMKIPLTGISPQIKEGIHLKVSVPGSAKSGQAPNYATVKPFDGWK